MDAWRGLAGGVAIQVVAFVSGYNIEVQVTIRIMHQFSLIEGSFSRDYGGDASEADSIHLVARNVLFGEVELVKIELPGFSPVVEADPVAVVRVVCSGGGAGGVRGGVGRKGECIDEYCGLGGSV